MKRLAIVALFISFNTLANCPETEVKTNLDELVGKISEQSSCEFKVLNYYKEIYHRTYKAASNTFLNNFVGRKNTFAHALGHPQIAFMQYGFNDNYIADGIVEKSGLSKEEVYQKYMEILNSNKLCDDLKADYKKPRKVRRYLLDALKN